MSLGYRKLGRDSAKRKALMRDLVTDLILNGRIETTLPKAKELQRLADSMVTLGKEGTQAAYVRAASLVRNEATEGDKPELAMTKLFKELAPKYKDRQGGYTRVLKTGFRRGDAAPMALIEFVD